MNDWYKLWASCNSRHRAARCQNGAASPSSGCLAPRVSPPSVVSWHFNVQFHISALQRSSILWEGEAALRVCCPAHHLAHDAVQFLVTQAAARQLAQHHLHVIGGDGAIACNVRQEQEGERDGLSGQGSKRETRAGQGKTRTHLHR